MEFWSVGTSRIAGSWPRRSIDADAFSIRWCAWVQGHELVTRRDLLPEEPHHPRADQRYYKLQPGKLVELQHPIPSRSLRRITFVLTNYHVDLVVCREGTLGVICGEPPRTAHSHLLYVTPAQIDAAPQKCVDTIHAAAAQLGGPAQR